MQIRTKHTDMPKCEIYEDVKGEWRWRRTKKNGEIVEFSKQGFKTREECEKNGKEEGPCTSYKLAL